MFVEFCPWHQDMVRPETTSSWFPRTVLLRFRTGPVYALYGPSFCLWKRFRPPSFLVSTPYCRGLLPIDGKHALGEDSRWNSSHVELAGRLNQLTLSTLGRNYGDVFYS